MEKKKRNWRSKYMLQSEWLHFLKNDWRHLKWEVHGIGVVLLIVLGLMTALFSLAISKLFGG